MYIILYNNIYDDDDETDNITQKSYMYLVSGDIMYLIYFHFRNSLERTLNRSLGIVIIT